MTINPNLYDILVAPVRTEKAFAQHETAKYSFYVREATSKTDVKKAVETIFGKKVTAINVVAARSKKKGARKGRIGIRTTMKKAIVTLEKGSNLNEVFGS